MNESIISKRGKEKPELVEVVGNILGRKVRVVNFDIVYENNEYRWKQAIIHPDDWTRSKFIARMVRSKYSDDDVIARILNLWITEDEASMDKIKEYDKEIKELQEWRIFVKKLADEVFNV